MIKQGLVGDHGVDRDVEGVGDRKFVEFAHNAIEDALGQAVASLECQVDVRPSSIVALGSRSVEYDALDFRMASEDGGDHRYGLFREAVPFVHDVAVSLKRSIAAGDHVYLVVIGCSPYFLTSNRGASNRRNRADGLPAEHPELLPLLGYGNGSGGSLSLSSQVVALCAPAVPPVAAAKRRSG